MIYKGCNVLDPIHLLRTKSLDNNSLSQAY